MIQVFCLNPAQLWLWSAFPPPLLSVLYGSWGQAKKFFIVIAVWWHLHRQMLKLWTFSLMGRRFFSVPFNHRLTRSTAIERLRFARCPQQEPRSCKQSIKLHFIHPISHTWNEEISLLWEKAFDRFIALVRIRYSRIVKRAKGRTNWKDDEKSRFTNVSLTLSSLCQCIYLSFGIKCCSKRLIHFARALATHLCPVYTSIASHSYKSHRPAG